MVEEERQLDSVGGGEGRGGLWLNLRLFIFHSFLASHHD